MSTWHYAIARTEHFDPTTGKPGYYYQVHEYYPDEEGKGGGWTQNPITPGGDTIEDLESELTMMLADVKARRKVLTLI